MIIDNCLAHPEVTGLKAVELVFLRPNTTSKTQPMDQGVIRALKAYYRSNLVKRQIKFISGKEVPKLTFVKGCKSWSFYGTLFLKTPSKTALRRQASQKKHKTRASVKLVTQYINPLYSIDVVYSSIAPSVSIFPEEKLWFNSQELLWSLYHALYSSVSMPSLFL